MILKLSDLFRKLYPEEKVEIVKTKVIRNETLDLIVEKYKEGLENCGLYSEKKLEIKIPKNEFDIYYIAKSSAPSKISSDNITEFSLLLDSLLLEEHENKEYFEDFTGCYLSALINKSKDKDFKIITNGLSKTIDYIGYENAKNIDVNGNAGDKVGDGMKNGEITINGNAGDEVGYYMEDGEITINGNAGYGVGDGMKDGKITINGNAGNYVGDIMENGKITVNGNAGDEVGWYMKNGGITVNGNAGNWVGGIMENGKITINGNAEVGVGWHMERGKIHLNGDYKSLSDFIHGGNIYHKDKLIVKNGRRLIINK